MDGAVDRGLLTVASHLAEFMLYDQNILFWLEMKVSVCNIFLLAAVYFAMSPSWGSDAGSVSDFIEQIVPICDYYLYSC